jgi:hypothetical protein
MLSRASDSEDPLCYIIDGKTSDYQGKAVFLNPWYNGVKCIPAIIGYSHNI